MQLLCRQFPHAHVYTRKHTRNHTFKTLSIISYTGQEAAKALHGHHSSNGSLPSNLTTLGVGGGGHGSSSSINSGQNRLLRLQHVPLIGGLAARLRHLCLTQCYVQDIRGIAVRVSSLHVIA